MNDGYAKSEAYTEGYQKQVKPSGSVSVNLNTHAHTEKAHTAAAIGALKTTRSTALLRFLDKNISDLMDVRKTMVNLQ